MAKWTFQEGDKVAVELVTSRNDFMWNGKLRLVHSRPSVARNGIPFDGIQNIIEFNHFDTKYAMKKFGIAQKRITSGAELLSAHYFGEIVK